MALTAPTPPTPPTIDKGDVQSSSPRIDAHQFFEVPEMPFREGTNKENFETVDDTPKVDEKVSVDEKPVSTVREVTTPEDMARDAVANGSGALTKRTVTRADDSQDDTVDGNSNSNVVTVPNVAPMPTTFSADRYERGQAVLREFRDEDRRAENSTENSTSTSTPTNFHNSTPYEENHGGIFWIVTLIFVVTATFFVAKKFLFRSKPALKKSDLFINSSEKLKSTAEKFSNAPKTSTPKKNSSQPKVSKTSPVKTSPLAEKAPPVKPVTLPKKDDDGKGKHFEIRV